MASIHDYTQSSPLKSFTLTYDHERQKKLEEIEKKNEQPFAFVRDQSIQMEESKKIKNDIHIINKEQSKINLSNKKQHLRTQRTSDALEREQLAQNYRNY